MKYKHYAVLDLEATCCDKGTIERDQMEVIEVGMVIIEADALAHSAEEKDFMFMRTLQHFVKPEVNPILTPFCTSLCHITQKDVDKGLTYEESITEIRDVLSLFPDTLFCSWGAYDYWQLHRQSLQRGTFFPFDGMDHCNLKARYAKIAGLESNNRRKQMGLRAALRHRGLTFKGTPHRALDDVLNTIRLIPFCNMEEVQK